MTEIKCSEIGKHEQRYFPPRLSVLFKIGSVRWPVILNILLSVIQPVIFNITGCITVQPREESQ